MPIRSHSASLRTVVATAVLAGAVLAGCNNGSPGTGAVPSSTAAPGGATAPAADVTLIAKDVKFGQTEFTAKAGSVTFAYKNDGQVRHTLVLEGVAGWRKLVVDTHGDIATETVTLKPGTYTLSCDIPGHRTSGMQASLSVET